MGDLGVFDPDLYANGDPWRSGLPLDLFAELRDGMRRQADDDVDGRHPAPKRSTPCVSRRPITFAAHG
jgi:hypothetical protein